MSVLQNIVEKFKPRPTDVNGVDFDIEETKLLRIRKNGSELNIVGVDTLPAFDFSAKNFQKTSVTIPLAIRSNYAAICLNVPGTSLKLLTTPGAIDAAFDEKLARNLGLPEDTTDRLSYRVLAQGSGRSESRVLAVGLPEPESTNCVSLFSSGLPAPWRFEASPVATLSAFEAGPVNAGEHETIGFIDFSARACGFSIFHKKSLVLLRRFDLGMEKVFNKITTSLNVDMATASNILADEAFDITDLLQDILQPLFSQLVVSREFIERRDSCSVQAIYLSGAFSSSDTAIQLIEHKLTIPVVPWNPFDIPNLSLPSPLPPELERQPWRFAAALGAALATFEEDE